MTTEKRSAFVNLRLTPSLKEALERAARENGRTLSSECEARLAGSAEAETAAHDAPTSALLRAIGSEIVEIESAIGARWSENAIAWAAVREMLTNGPIVRLRQPDPARAQQIRDTQRRLGQLSHRKREVIALLRENGLTVEDDPWTELNALARFEVSQGLPPRNKLRQQIEGVEIDGRDLLLQAAQLLESDDKKEQAARDKLRELASDLVEALEHGKSFAEPAAPDAELAEAMRQINIREAGSRPPTLAQSLGALFSHGKRDDNAG